jgi:hypothetical protein
MFIGWVVAVLDLFSNLIQFSELETASKSPERVSEVFWVSQETEIF